MKIVITVILLAFIATSEGAKEDTLSRKPEIDSLSYYRNQTFIQLHVTDSLLNKTITNESKISLPKGNHP